MKPFTHCPQCNNSLSNNDNIDLEYQKIYTVQSCPCIGFNQFLALNGTDLIWFQFYTPNFCVEVDNELPPILHNTVYILSSSQPKENKTHLIRFEGKKFPINFPLDINILDQKLSIYITFS